MANYYFVRKHLSQCCINYYSCSTLIALLGLLVWIERVTCLPNNQNEVPVEREDKYYTCSHQYPRPHEVILGAVSEPHHIIRKRSIDQPLRIHLHYDHSIYKLEKHKFDIITKTVLPDALSYWQKALKVRKTEQRILLNRRCPNNLMYHKTDDPHSRYYCRSHCEVTTMCGEVKVPEEHLDACHACDERGFNCQALPGTSIGAGVTNSDFVFYVSALQTDGCYNQETLAYASHCQQESALERPIAGHANICPKSLNKNVGKLISTVKHEILHALGFSSSLYAFFRDDEGAPLTPRDSLGKPILNEKLQVRQWSDRIVQKFKRSDWRVAGGTTTREVHMIVTPRVVREVRKHFNCPDLEGAELEDQGGSGTALVHWEKRIFQNEAMTGAQTPNPVYSRMTFAFMEDTGWYRANYDMAEELHWGRNLGCDFVKKSCMDWMTSRKDPSPFCNKIKSIPFETQCTDDHNSVGSCNLVKYAQPLPVAYQNFEDFPKNSKGSHVVGSYYGGSIMLADYCPFVQGFSWNSNNVAVRDSHCYDEKNQLKADNNLALEEYGKGAKCFYHTEGLWEKTSPTHKWTKSFGSGCYKYSCHDGYFNVTVSKKPFKCDYAGKELRVHLTLNELNYRGGIKCPSFKSFCQHSASASLFQRQDSSSAFIIIAITLALASMILI